MINWKKIRFTFDEQPYGNKRINAHILFSSGIIYDAQHGMNPEITEAIMKRLVRELFYVVYGDMRGHLMRIRERMLQNCTTAADWDSIDKMFEPLWKQITPPKLDEILAEGTTRDGGGGTIIPSATPNPNPCTATVGRITGEARAPEPRQEVAPSGSEIESYVAPRKP